MIQDELFKLIYMQIEDSSNLIIHNSVIRNLNKILQVRKLTTAFSDFLQFTFIEIFLFSPFFRIQLCISQHFAAMRKVRELWFASLYRYLHVENWCAHHNCLLISALY